MSMMPVDTEAILRSFARYVEAVKLVGGVSAHEVLEGKPIPDGFVHDENIDWYVPWWFAYGHFNTDMTH